jgi:PleD family two-component response regulator
VPDDAGDAETLIRRADAALYEGKRSRSAITLRAL